MNIEEQFSEAVKSSKELTVRPSNEILLKLYALYKQGSEGEVSGERPGGFDFKGAAKYDAWQTISGMAFEDAKHEYIGLVSSLIANEK